MQGKENAIPELENFLSSLTIGEVQIHKHVAVYPVYSEKAGNNGYKLMDEAIKTDLFVVTEVSHDGSVNEILAINNLESDVLMLDGEELVGAKQNRILNTTIIVAKATKTSIPVSCVEQKSWSYRSKHFGTSKWSLSADIRREKAKAVKESLKSHEGYRSDQSRIWSKLREKSANLDASCATEAMDSMYENYEVELNAYQAAFSVQQDQIGFIACIDGRIEGCDLLALQSVFPKIYAKMLRGYLIDAIERQRQGHLEQKRRANVVTTDDIYAFLQKVKGTKKEAFKSAGEGQDVRFDSLGVEGFALMRDGAAIHMAAFAT